jgi:UDPglucose 6-dehydrogenase
MKVTVFGTGYVGLVQGAILADAGHQVVCVDIDEKKLENLRNGIIPIYEPGLDSIVKNTVSEGRLSFTSNAKDAVAHGEIQFIAVGTPPNEDGSADLKHVLAVAKTIATHMEHYCVVVDKSTVPVGTADQVQAVITQTLSGRGVSVEFDVVSNPEFLKEGAAVADCQRPDRIVIGTESQRAENMLRELYEPFNRNHDRIITMSVKSAELTKYAANCMLATKISFMNEIANLAEKLGADIESVRQGIGSDQRIGYHFIYPGAGYGGSCFPKDVSALVKIAHSIGFDPKILNAVEARNQAQKRVVFEKIKNYFNDELKGKTIAIWGLAFKPNTDDMREAPSRVLMEALWAEGVKVLAYDPKSMEETQHIYADQELLHLCGTKEAALKGADALVIMTEWRQFKAPDFDLIKASLREPVIFDGRNLYEPKRMKEKGFTYFGIGRQS